MKAHKSMWCAGALALAMTGMAQASSVEESAEVSDAERELTMQCYDAAMASDDADEFESSQLLMDQQNADEFEQGEELMLHINMLGHGTTMFNVECNVDEQGNVTYEEFKKSGTPAGSTR